MSAPLLNQSPLLRVGLSLVAALVVALVAACGSEPEPSPPPTVAPTVAPLVMPTATPAPTPAARTQESAKAPDFSLTSADGEQVSLSGLLEEHQAVVMVFYRGFF